MGTTKYEAAHSCAQPKKYEKNINIVCISLHSEGSADYGRKKKSRILQKIQKSKKKYQDQIEKHCYNFYHCIVLFLHTVILCYYYYCLYHVFYYCYSMLYLHLYFSLLCNNTKIFFKNNDIKLHHCQNHEMSQQQQQKKEMNNVKMIIERSENSIIDINE